MEDYRTWDVSVGGAASWKGVDKFCHVHCAIDHCPGQGSVTFDLPQSTSLRSRQWNSYLTFISYQPNYFPCSDCLSNFVPNRSACSLEERKLQRSSPSANEKLIDVLIPKEPTFHPHCRVQVREKTSGLSQPSSPPLQVKRLPQPFFFAQVVGTVLLFGI